MAISLGTGLLTGGLALLGSNSASSAAKDAANAQLESAKIAADAAAFKPYSVSTGLGSSWFNPDKQTAGYTLDPALQAYRDKLMTFGADALPASVTGVDPTINKYSSGALSLAQQGMPSNLNMDAASQAAQNRFYGAYGKALPQDMQNIDPRQAAYRDAMLKQSYAAMPTTMDANQAASNYYNEMKAMQEPLRAQERQQLQQDIFGGGRLGLRLAGEATGAGATGGMYQPDVFGYNQAALMADQQLAYNARQQSQAEIDQALGRSANLYGQSASAEDLGQGIMSNQLDRGLNLYTAGQGAQAFGNQQVNDQIARSAGLFNTGIAGRQYGQSEIDQAIARGTGLFQTGIGVEQLGLTPLELGGSFGGKASAAGSAQATALMSGGMGAAQANLAGGLNTANMFSGLAGNLLKYNS